MVNCLALHDILGTATEDEVHGWYSRAADELDRLAGSFGASSSFAGSNLRRFLNPTPELRRTSRSSRMDLRIPDYVMSHPTTQDAIEHHKRVYLSRQNARIEPPRIAGARVRIQNPAAHGWIVGTPMLMHYESLVDYPVTTPGGMPFGTQEQRQAAHIDVRNAIGGCQLRSEVQLIVDLGRRTGTFFLFVCRLLDDYDFDPERGMLLPNPDHNGSSGGLCPGLSHIYAKHSNLQRLIDTGRARNWYWRSSPWVPAGVLGSSGRIGP